MARLARLCIPGWPHLVVQRGHDRRPVCLDDDDRQLFRDLLREAARLNEVRVHAYGLFETEVRLLATPSTPDGLSKLIQAIGRRYVARFNRRHGRSGGLWEGRFRATVIDPVPYLLPCMLYVEGADAEPGLLPDAQAWSSAAHHLGFRLDPLVTDAAAYWGLGNTPFEREAAYRSLYQQALTDKQLVEIRAALKASWPLGDEHFRLRLAGETSRRLIPRPRGRPRAI